jgi:hypothetical protein
MPGTPQATNDFQETYLRAILGFNGIEDIEIVRRGPRLRRRTTRSAFEAVVTAIFPEHTATIEFAVSSPAIPEQSPSASVVSSACRLRGGGGVVCQRGEQSPARVRVSGATLRLSDAALIFSAAVRPVGLRAERLARSEGIFASTVNARFGASGELAGDEGGRLDRDAVQCRITPAVASGSATASCRLGRPARPRRSRELRRQLAEARISPTVVAMAEACARRCRQSIARARPRLYLWNN